MGCGLLPFSSMDVMTFVGFFKKIALFYAKERPEKTEIAQPRLLAKHPSVSLPPILLSGDNARSALMLHSDLVEQGFQMQLAGSYDELRALWEQKRHPMVLLDVSGAHSVEAAVSTALRLKQVDPLLFVGYLADPALHSSGLTGDAIFPRTSEQLAKALKTHFHN
jgi:hypothetical protein